MTTDYHKYRVNLWTGEGLGLRRISEVVEARNSQEAIGVAIVRLRVVEPNTEVRIGSITACQDHDTEDAVS